MKLCCEYLLCFISRCFLRHFTWRWHTFPYSLDDFDRYYSTKRLRIDWKRIVAKLNINTYTLSTKFWNLITTWTENNFIRFWANNVYPGWCQWNEPKKYHRDNVNFMHLIKKGGFIEKRLMTQTWHKPRTKNMLIVFATKWESKMWLKDDDVDAGFAIFSSHRLECWLARRRASRLRRATWW